MIDNLASKINLNEAILKRDVAPGLVSLYWFVFSNQVDGKTLS